LPEPTKIDLRELTGSTARVAFVGQSTFFEACSLEPEAGVQVGVESTFIEYRDGAEIDDVLEALAAFGPDVTVVFRPEIVPPGAFYGLPGAVLGFLTEPLPRREKGAVAHQDLESRLEVMRRIDPGNVDRVVAFDPMIAAAAAEVVPVWRSVPLPVADRFYRPVGASVPHPKALFVGRSTPHREAFLKEAKEEGAVLHLAFGVDAGHLQELMAGHDIAVNVHNEPYPTFENRVCLHLAAGQLLVSEPISPSHGLEAGIDYLEAADGAVLAEMLGRLRHIPGVWRDVRLRGRQKAELYRASRVYPRLFFDLTADMRTRPSARPGGAPTAVRVG
jgi:hypothetical protein